MQRTCTQFPCAQFNGHASSSILTLAANGAVTFLHGAKSLWIAICYEPALAEAQPLAATTLKDPSSPSAPATNAPSASAPTTTPAQPATPSAAPTPAPAKPAKPTAKPNAPSTGQTGAPKYTRCGPKIVSPTTTTWKRCTGQQHHAISKVIHSALENHPNLKGVYNYRDNRFVTQAIDKSVHTGYQKWHIDLDKEIANHIRIDKKLTPATFEAYLRQRYAASDLIMRFPNGL